MLITGKEMLEVAKKHHFAVPAFNAGSGQLLPAIMDACKEEKAPFIMAIHPDELSFLRDSFIGQVMDEINATELPVALHLDHGANIDQILHAIQLGFSSVMIDGSSLPFEENVKQTQEVVKLAHAVGVSVEAELGTIGDTGNNVEGGVSEIIYTDPEKAKEFVERTGVDSLAVAIGTAHGLYPKNMKPKLRLDILEEITKLVDVPLVLHGGSSNPDEEISKSVEIGVSKINISSDIKISFTEKLREILNNGNMEIREPNVIFPDCMEAAKKTAIEKIRLFKTNDTEKYYFEK
ncbi:ketose-bisphosphate aldolase [Faecalicoccus pleomorphus]|uniref:Ketose-bisphosphate aldolase n=1 Tax=Faecalicoccus pleomorphus TaxID=1323 RepID=A0A7X9RKF1_9FIRM|nr:ketose-bisphosphate aldolase [Faecalicoccus pleomorphus]MBM6678924.1 ketose-bisphosphate aldolase [Faecalicoccus pleomorphus]MBM6765494.1 ketose-bisphosphate aldolase [Faecalicoccus pleomorphus]MBM6809300.1 ketose-bisphosphate aldolase [Faecalicoccus pleomorphus]NME45249.1 ketose-bisphosphate aldolase [Faecalicoccus pleomorphus]